MNFDAKMARLELRFAALRGEEARRRTALVEACCARLAQPEALVVAGALGAALGSLGGGRRETSAPPAARKGPLLALAGLAATVLRLAELRMLFTKAA